MVLRGVPEIYNGFGTEVVGSPNGLGRGAKKAPNMVILGFFFVDSEPFNRIPLELLSIPLEA